MGVVGRRSRRGWGWGWVLREGSRVLRSSLMGELLTLLPNHCVVVGVCQVVPGKMGIGTVWIFACEVAFLMT